VTVSLGIVCEAAADRETATGLADRLFCAEVDWITPEVLEDYRKWRGLDDYALFLSWQDVHTQATERNIRAFGHFQGEPGAPDARVARLALLLLITSSQKPDGIVLIRDDDRQTERRRGLEQARDSVAAGVPIVIGLAHTKRECWVLAGFHPRSDEERAACAALRQELGFDPCAQAENLTATDDQAKKSAKRVLGVLTDHDKNREEECWKRSDLMSLEQRGQLTGLAAFFQEIRTHLIPLFSPVT
jgi:hypothetical protein